MLADYLVTFHSKCSVPTPDSMLTRLHAVGRRRRIGGLDDSDSVCGWRARPDLSSRGSGEHERADAGSQ